MKIMKTARLIMLLVMISVLPIHSVYADADGSTVLASLSSEGVQGNNSSALVEISADGRFVAFTSLASNLVPNDTNGTYDVFVYDLMTGITEMVSVNNEGFQGNDQSTSSSISADGRYVAFTSWATNLVPGDSNGTYDVFVHDRATGTTELVSVSTQGVQGNLPSSIPAISADGRFVAFQSFSDNLVQNDLNATGDVFVRDLENGTTELVSISSDGIQGNKESRYASVSADGRFVAFLSYDGNLVPGVTNGLGGIFVRDRLYGTTEMVSVSSAGVPADNSSNGVPSISGDGSRVAFRSRATNLVPGDTNATEDIFVRDRVIGTTVRVSVSSDGVQANNSSLAPAISLDGQTVAFESYATNLLARTIDPRTHIYAHDLATGETEIMSVRNAGILGNGSSTWPSISGDGLSVAFESGATNLVVGDNNSKYDAFVHIRVPRGQQ